MAIEGIIFDIKRFAVHDGPGIRTTVFFKGCPLRCQWCHNPEGISPEPEVMVFADRCLKNCRDCLASCPQGALRKSRSGIVLDRARCDVCGACDDVCPADALQVVGKPISPDALMEVLAKDAAFYRESGGGITVSGGEPLQQPEFLNELLKQCRLQKFDVALDTCGYAPYREIEKILPLVDLFLYDLKAVDDDRHRRLTGVSNRLILENLERLSREGAPLAVRVPLVPGANDSVEELERMADFCVSLPRRHPVHLLPYHRGYQGKLRRLGRDAPPADAVPPSQAEVDRAGGIFRRHELTVQVGG